MRDELEPSAGLLRSASDAQPSRKQRFAELMSRLARTPYEQRAAVIKQECHLETLSRETGAPVDVARTFAGISDPANAHMFSAEAARQALSRQSVETDESLGVSAAIESLSREELDELLASSEAAAEQLRQVRAFLATPRAQAVLAGPCNDFGSEEELRFLEARNAVSDPELVARVNSAPDLGGALLAELMSVGVPTCEAGAGLGVPEREALTKRFDEDCAAARQGGEQPSAYFLDKCGAEAGDFSESVYLLFRDEQSVQWSLDRHELCQALCAVLADGGSFAHNEVLELRVSAELAQRLAAHSCPETEPPFALNEQARASLESQRAEERAYLATKPGWVAKEGLRVFVTFLSNGACRWSPSDLNIEGIIARSPAGAFLSPALRLDLTEEQEVDLTAFFKWAADNV